MCDRPTPCRECPLLLDCHEPTAEDVRRGQITGGVLPGGMADTLLVQALAKRPTSEYDLWRGVPGVLQTVARRLVFDGANPDDVIALLAQAYALGVAGLPDPPLPSRTGPDPDAYMEGHEAPTRNAQPCARQATPRAANLYRTVGGGLAYKLDAGPWLAYNVEECTWALADMNAGNTTGRAPFDAYHLVFDSLVKALREVQS